MGKLSFHSILICLGLLLVGNLAGWTISAMFVNEAASLSFLRFGVAAAASIFFVQILAFRFCQKGVSGEFIFRGMSGLSLIWFLISLVLPLAWMQEFSFQGKLISIGLSLLLFIFNFENGWRHFNEQWAQQTPVIEKVIARAGAALDWVEIEKKLDLSISIHIPGFSKSIEPILSILLVVSMIAGFNLRKIFPIFSMFAWGIPCIVVSSMVVQMIAINFAKGAKISKLEKERGVKFDHR